MKTSSTQYASLKNVYGPCNRVTATMKKAVYDRSMSSQMKLAHEVARELTRAQSLFPAINTPHEGLAVVWEEFEEFKLEVFALNIAKGRDTREAMRKELIQLAAMALRTIHDCALPASPTSPTEKKE